MAGVDARGESDMAGAGGTVTGLDRALSYALGRLGKRLGWESWDGPETGAEGCYQAYLRG